MISSTHRPAFRPRFSFRADIPEGLQVSSEDGCTTFAGRAFAAVAPLLDGQRTAEDIVLELQHELPAEQIWYALFTLQCGGFTADVDTALPHAEAAYWDTLDVAPSFVLERLSSSTCALREIGDDTRGELATAFAQTGIEPLPEQKRVLVLVDSYLNPDLNTWSKEATRRGIEWMVARAIGPVLWIGPVFRPGQSFCWNCFAARLRENGVNPNPSPAWLPATRSAGLLMIAAEVAKWIVLGDRYVVDAIQTWDFARGGYTVHKVQTSAHYSFCEHPEPQPADTSGGPLTEQPFAAEAGFRSCSPAETLEQLRQIVSPLTGIVSHIAAVPADASQSAVFTPVYEAPLNIGRCPSYGPVIARGKGVSHIQAQVSCLAEAVERYSMFRTGTEAVTRCSKGSLPGRALDLYDLLGLPFDSVEERDWLAATSYSTGDTVYLPAEYCYLDLLRPTPATSNGCAAGNSLPEAMLQGLLELVERDAVSVWWHNGIQRRAVDLESFEDGFLRSARSMASCNGRRLHVLDVSTDIAIPVFVAVSAGNPQSSDRDSVLLGCGAHPDARIAIGRALTELAQVGAVLARRPVKSVCSLSQHPHLEPTDYAASASDFPPLRTSSVQEALDHCVRLVEELGFEVIFVDMTRTGLRVARVIIPGLQPLHPNFNAPRLRQLPVAMGWLDRPRTLEDLKMFAFPM